MREPPPISDDSLLNCLRDEYDLRADAIEFLPVGLDSRAGVYRVTDDTKTSWLVKVKSGPLYEPGCLVTAYLHGQGITEVVAPTPTTSHALWAIVGEWTVIVYPFIEGDTGWRSITAAHWEAAGGIFRRIHEISMPPNGFASLRSEAFDPSEYTRAIHGFEERLALPPGAISPAERALHIAWMERQSFIHTAIARMESLAPMLQQRRLPYVICHADLHPGNLLRSPDGGVHVLDWDDVMLAPRERDFIFVGDTRSTRASSPAPFFRGYGEVEIDWGALTYYRYERIIQDVIACVDEVCFRDDLSDEAKTDATALFSDVLAEGGMLDGAEEAARRLPPGLLTQ